MIIYCYVLLAFALISLGNIISKSDAENFGFWLGDLLLTLPFIGRILGWW